MTERGIKSNQREADDLFHRGVAAARSGQRRMAAVLLSRAVQFEPRHEQAWLWLSGVMDEPDQIAFCLRSVLGINPHNERAIQGLKWLEQRRMTSQPATPEPFAAATPTSVSSEEADRAPGTRWNRLHALRTRVRRPRPTNAPAAPRQPDAWWATWRRTRREMSHAWTFVWSTLIVVWLLLLGLHYTLRQTVERQTALAQAAARPTNAPTASALTPVPVPVFESNSDATQNAAVLAYLSQIEPPRAQLRVAIQTYRDATSKPGGAAVTHVAAAQALRGQLETAYTALAAVTPPPVLDQAHDHYLSGLKQEQSAMDDMLEFYGSYGVQFINRATVRMLDAAKELDRAKTIFQHYQSTANDPARRAGFTAR